MQTESQSFKCRIPWVMAAARAALGPVLVLAERAGWNGLTLAAMVVTALLSDIFDGVLARCWKCDTAAVRLFDSMADIVFYIGCAAALWMRRPQLMHRFAVPVAIITVLEFMKLAFDIAKFGKPSSYHSYLAKTWGLVLATTVVLSFATANTLASRIAWWMAFSLGLLCNLEGFTISLVMPEWRHDLKSLSRAIGVRRRILLDRQRAAKRSLRAAATAAAAILLAITSVPSRASSIPSVTFIGGSTQGITAGTRGVLDTGSDQLTFKWNGSALGIPYTQIQNFSYRENAVNLGALPIIAIALLRPLPRRHIVSITYIDPSGQKQVAIFEVPKQARNILPVVLQERTGVCADQYQLPCRTGVSPTKPLIHGSIAR